MWIQVDPSLQSDFPDLKALICSINGLEVNKESNNLTAFKEQLLTEVHTKYELDTLRDIHNFRAYRDFFWRVKIDPTKIRPASEALVRRILANKPIPKINTVVDTYNLVSIKTEIPIAAFDRDQLDGSLLLRYAQPEELFQGIGWRESKKLGGGEIVVADSTKLVAIYPYRDADNTKISAQTRNVLMLICGAPGITDQQLQTAAEVTIDHITRFCGGSGKIGY